MSGQYDKYVLLLNIDQPLEEGQVFLVYPGDNMLDKLQEAIYFVYGSNPPGKLWVFDEANEATECYTILSYED